MKHNKKRNTAFLYECLIKEITKAVVRKDETRKDTIIKIVKEHFTKGMPLWEDLQLYKQLQETKGLNNDFASRYILEVKKDWESLNRKDIFNQQTILIKKINESLGSDVFGNFVENYRNLATIGHFFNFSDNGLGLKSFMNEELGRLKEEIGSLSDTKHAEKLAMVNEKIDSYSKTPLTEEIVKEVFYIQDLIAEIKK
jgi:hypothetical protein